MKTPILEGHRIDRFSVSVWCPWCEKQHAHGSSEGHRVAHCDPLPAWLLRVSGASPLLSMGYSTNIVEDAAPPSPPLLRQSPNPYRLQKLGPLAARLENCEYVLRKAIYATLGLRGAWCGSVFECDISGAKVTITRKRWSLVRAGVRRVEFGTNRLGLFAALSGLPSGVAAVRVLETVAGVWLDASAALEISRAVDDWRKRGAPAGRRWGEAE